MAGRIVKVASTVTALCGIKKVVFGLVALAKVTPGLDVVQVLKAIELTKFIIDIAMPKVTVEPGA